MRALVLTFSLLATFAAGCLADRDDGLDLGSEPPRPRLPSGLTMDGGEVVTYAEDVVQWRWRGEAPPHPTGIVSAVAEHPLERPYVETAFDVPAGIDLVVAAQVDAADTERRLDPKLALAIRSEDGKVLCLSEIGGSSFQSCGAAVPALREPGRLWLRVESAFVQATRGGFVAQVTLSLPLVPAASEAAPGEIHPEPHVIVSVTDTGVNPYHEVYHRPDRTQHPCDYIEGFPCEVERLPLSIGIYDDYALAVAADQAIWDSVEPAKWYWIPETALVAVQCARAGDGCILDKDGHGTATTSMVLAENPDALLAVTQGEAEDARSVAGSGIPVDLHSFSWALPYPAVADASGPYVGRCQEYVRSMVEPAKLFLAAAGNWPEFGSPSTFADCEKGDPNIITVGGATASDRSQRGTQHPEIVSWLCRETASATRVSGTIRQCGTSIAAPSAAGALSRVILDLRRHSGYVGSVVDGMVDPTLGISNGDVRSAMNLTASYDPPARHDETSPGLVLNPAAPWLQWGWGFYDSAMVDATVKHLLATGVASKPAGAVQWMEAQHEVKKALWGT